MSQIIDYVTDYILKLLNPTHHTQIKRISFNFVTLGVPIKFNKL